MVSTVIINGTNEGQKLLINAPEDDKKDSTSVSRLASTMIYVVGIIARLATPDTIHYIIRGRRYRLFHLVDLLERVLGRAIPPQK